MTTNIGHLQKRVYDHIYAAMMKESVYLEEIGSAALVEAIRKGYHSKRDTGQQDVLTVKEITALWGSRVTRPVRTQGGRMKGEHYRNYRNAKCG